MARRRRKKRSLVSRISIPKLPELDLDPETKKGIFIVFLLALGAISMLGLFDLASDLGVYLKSGLVWAFGQGKWLYPVLIFVWAFFLYSEERRLKGSNYLGLFLFVISFQTLLTLFVERDQWEKALEMGVGGGMLGLFLAGVFVNLMGFIASLIVSLSILIISLLLLLDTTLTRLLGSESWFAKVLHPVNFLVAKFLKKKEVTEDEEGTEEMEEEEMEEEEEEEEEMEEEEEEEEEMEEEEEEEEEDETEEEEDEVPEFMKPTVKDPAKEEDSDEDPWWMKPSGIDIKLPLTLLNGKRGKPTSGDIEDNKEIIRNTLEQFKIPVDMGKVSIGPTVTQYTFKPAKGVKLSKITTLGNDLALSLAAHPIRIEAPIPGKSLVGVEVPNEAKAVVSLKEVLASKNYKERKHDMMVALGKDVAGNTWLDDVTKMPHLLVAGATNSGKSVCLNTIIVSLLYQNNPDDLRFIMVDPKRVELPGYNGLPHMMCPVITDVKKTVNALNWCLREMDSRFDFFSKSGHRNIQAYNETAEVKMPYIVFIIDELADLMVTAAKEIESSVIRLAQMSRAVGIHLILATQRPSVNVITGLIKANMPARIAFSVASGQDSRTILDSTGAEKLLGQGDMLVINSQISKPLRLQGAYLSDAEIKKVVRFIKQKGGKANFVEGIVDQSSGPGVPGMPGGDDGGDDLFEEAKEIVINMGKASASLLQRRLSIGYARAARIMDLLESAGIIGPANGAKPREIMVSKEQYEALSDAGTSGVSIHSRDEAEAPESYLGEEDDGDVPPVFVSEKIEDEEEEEVEEEENDEIEEEKEKSENKEEEKEEEDEEMEESEEETKNEESKEEPENDNKEDEDDGRYFSR